MNAIILSVGTELVTGQCLDTNSAWLAGRLAERGVTTLEHRTVGDDPGHLAYALREGMAAADVVIVTGGLGPTLDDLTRDAIAAAVGSPLEENAEALGQIEAFFRRIDRAVSESNRRQALVPRGGGVIANPRGTAPGIAWPAEAPRIWALPGVPAEMKVMFEQSVAAALGPAAGESGIRVRRLLCFGVTEARLGEQIADLMARGRNPLVGTTASDAVLTVRIVAASETAAEAARLADDDAVEVRRRIGSAVFGEEDDTLQSVVARLLRAQGKTIATAESCTGGLLAEWLTETSGSSAYFLRGLVTYSNQAKIDELGVSPDEIAKHGAVSEAVAKAMAIGCRAAAGSDFALSITGIAGPGGGSEEKPVGLVHVGLADGERVVVRRFTFGEHLTRREIRDRSVKAAINMLRLRMLQAD